MKRSLLLILSIIICLSSQAQYFDYNKAEKKRVQKHNIKSITQTNYKYKKGKLSKNGVLNSKKVFDKKGNKVEEILYRADSIGTRMISVYNSADQLIKFENYKGRFVKSQLQEYVYENGVLVKEKGFNGNLGKYLTEYKYNPDGTNYLTLLFSHSEYPDEKWEYKHDDEDIEIDVYKRGRLSEKIVREFDNKQRLITEVKFNKENKESLKREFKYNSQGLLVEVNEYRFGKFILKEEIVYKNGLISEVYITKKDKAKMLDKSFTYDAKNNLIEEKWYDGKPGKYSSRRQKYSSEGLLLETDVHHAVYNYKVKNKYTYEKF